MPPERRPVAPLIGLVQLGVLVLATRLPLVALPGPGRDEATYHYWAHNPEPAYAPLLQLAVWLGEGILGHSTWSLRLPSLILGLVVLLLADLRLRGLRASVGARLLAAFAVALTPWQAFAGAILHPDVFLLAALLALVLAAQHGRLWWLVAAAVGALLAKPTGALALPVAAWLAGSPAVAGRPAMAAWLAGPLPLAGRRQVLAARLVLGAVAVAYLAVLDPQLVAGMAEFGQAPARLSPWVRAGSWVLALLFLGGPLLLSLAGVGLRERWLRLRGVRPGNDQPGRPGQPRQPGEPAARREALASLALAAALVTVFVAAAVFRGQFKANWVLPAAVLLLPAGPVAWPRWVRAGGVAVATVCCLAQALALWQPDLVDRIEALAGDGAPSYAVHASVREGRVAAAGRWSEYLRQFDDRAAFACKLQRAWRTQEPEMAPPAWLVSDDYGLAMQVHWYLGHGAVWVAVPGDGVFVRSNRHLAGADHPGNLLVLPVNRNPAAIWKDLQLGDRLPMVAHPATGALLTPYPAQMVPEAERNHRP